MSQFENLKIESTVIVRLAPLGVGASEGIGGHLSGVLVMFAPDLMSSSYICNGHALQTRAIGGVPSIQSKHWVWL